MTKSEKVKIYLIGGLLLAVVITLSIIIFSIKDTGALDAKIQMLEAERDTYFQERKDLIQKLDQLEQQNKKLKSKYHKAVKDYESSPVYNNYNNAVDGFYNSR